MLAADVVRPPGEVGVCIVIAEARGVGEQLSVGISGRNADGNAAMNDLAT